MLLDIATNVIANVVFWLGLGFAVAAMARIAQRRFRRFFGLHTNQQLVVCLSNLWTTATSSRPRGYAVSLSLFHPWFSRVRMALAWVVTWWVLQRARWRMAQFLRVAKPRSPRPRLVAWAVLAAL